MFQTDSRASEHLEFQLKELDLCVVLSQLIFGVLLRGEMYCNIQLIVFVILL